MKKGPRTQRAGRRKMREGRVIKQTLVHNEYLVTSCDGARPQPAGLQGAVPHRASREGAESTVTLRRCYFSDLISFGCSLQTCRLPSEVPAMELGHRSGPRCQHLSKVRENSYEHQVCWL